MSGNGDLSPRQQRAVAHLLECSTIAEASKKTGVHRSTLYEWMKNPAFQVELERAKRDQFQAALGQMRSLVPDAIESLKELASSSNEQVRLRACVEILKATRAYGVSASPLTFNPEDSPFKVSLEYASQLTLRIIEKVLAGELSASEANALLHALSKLEEFGQETLLMGYEVILENMYRDLPCALKDTKGVDMEKFCQKLRETLDLKLGLVERPRGNSRQTS
jgi:transposase-like protein